MKLKMKIETLMEVVCATHLSSYVEGMSGATGSERGGLFICGAPGVMKTSILAISKNYPNAEICSDLNVQTLNAMKPQLSNNIMRSLVFPDLQKLYERDPRVAKNIEGHIKSLAAEGFASASFESHTCARFTARATIIGAMTDDFQQQNWTRWEKDGLVRRFLWGLIKLKDPYRLNRSVVDWERIDLGAISIPQLPTSDSIPMCLTRDERAKLEIFVRWQPKPNNFAFQQLCRVAAVLRWHYNRTKQKRDALKTITEFAECLTKDGTEVELPE